MSDIIINDYKLMYDLKTDREALLHWLKFGRHHNLYKSIKDKQLDRKERKKNIKKSFIISNNIFDNNSYPLVNIITRTHNRKKEFKFCRWSIKNQTYKNILHHVIYDTDFSNSYIEDDINMRKINLISYYRQTDKNIANYNLYINHVINDLIGEFCLILDDDDVILYNNVIERLFLLYIKYNKNIICQYKIGNNILPNPSKKIDAGNLPICSVFFKYTNNSSLTNEIIGDYKFFYEELKMKNENNFIFFPFVFFSSQYKSRSFGN